MSLGVYLWRDVPSYDPDTNEYIPTHERLLFEANITHNLNRMANAAGIYQAVWRPEEVGITTAAQLIPHLQSGLSWLKLRPGQFKKLNPEKGWDNYDGFVEWLERYLEACQENPSARVGVSR